MKRILPSHKQKLAIDNIMSGKFKSPRQAMKAAGYTGGTSAPALLQQTGVQTYIAGFEKKALVKFGVSLDDKLMDVYLDGLDAKTVGKFGGDVDHKVRKEFADTIATMKGYLKDKETGSKTQVNFFQFNKAEQEDFNRNFIKFIRQEG